MIKIVEDKRIQFRFNPSVRKVITINDCKLYTDGTNKYVKFSLKNIFVEDLQGVEYCFELYDRNNVLLKTVSSKQELGVRSGYIREIIDETPIDVECEYLVIVVTKINFLTVTMQEGYFDFGVNQNVNKAKVNKRITEYQIKKPANGYIDLTLFFMFMSVILIALWMFLSQGDFVTIFG